MLEHGGFQILTFGGERFVVLPEAEFLRLTRETPKPALPAPNEHGNYPALDAARALMARDIIRSRRTLGWSQAELARRAGVRAETLNRIEQGKHSASISTIDKLDRALKAGETAGKGTSRPGPIGSARKRKRK